MNLADIDAVLFDMDGTLIDSERMTRAVVDELLLEGGADPASVADEELHGFTWSAIAARIAQRHPQLGARCSAVALQARWMDLWRREPQPPIPGVEGVLASAKAAGLRLALATSSEREAADALMERAAFSGVFDVWVTADDIERSKPDPEIFLVAAERLGVPPRRCLVFEDSIAGLIGARAAGMARVAVLLRSADPERARSLADRAIVDYTELPEDFFARQ